MTDLNVQHAQYGQQQQTCLDQHDCGRNHQLAAHLGVVGIDTIRNSNLFFGVLSRSRIASGR